MGGQREPLVTPPGACRASPEYLIGESCGVGRPAGLACRLQSAAARSAGWLAGPGCDHAVSLRATDPAAGAGALACSTVRGNV